MVKVFGLKGDSKDIGSEEMPSEPDNDFGLRVIKLTHSEIT